MIQPLATLAEKLAWRTLGMGIVGVVGGGLLTIVGLATGVLAIVGLVLFGCGLVAIPLGIARILEPTRHPAIAPLGRTPFERNHVLRYIDAELFANVTFRMPAGGGTCHITPNWIVYASRGDLVIACRHDVVWLWPAVLRRRRRFGSETTSESVKLHTRRSTSPLEIPFFAYERQVYPALVQSCPFAFAGYDQRCNQTPRHVLAAEVDRRRAMAAPR